MLTLNFRRPAGLICDFHLHSGSTTGFDPPISVFRPHQLSATVRSQFGDHRTSWSPPAAQHGINFSADDQPDLTVGCSSLGSARPLSAFQVLQRACASELLVWNLGASAPLPQSSTKETTAGEESHIPGGGAQRPVWKISLQVSRSRVPLSLGSFPAAMASPPLSRLLKSPTSSCQ